MNRPKAPFCISWTKLNYIYLLDKTELYLLDKTELSSILKPTTSEDLKVPDIYHQQYRLLDKKKEFGT